MGNLKPEEKFLAVVGGILLAPFFFVREILYSTGIIKRPQYEWKENKEIDNNENIS
jgi:hypothetical protein